MASKPKSKTYVVHHNGNYGEPTVVGRYLVGAKNEKEAQQFLRDAVGKHIKTRVYYEEQKKTLPHGMVIRDRPGG